MAFSANTADKESLQTLAMAVRQEVETDLTPDVLESYMADLPALDPRIKKHCKIDYSKMSTRFANWLEEGATDWIESSCYIANKTYSPLFKRATYNFYRQDYVPDFKGTFNRIKKDIKNKASMQLMKKMYDIVGMSEDKWNPADIIAIKANKESNVINQLKNFKASKHSKMSKEVDEANKKMNSGMPREARSNITLMKDLDEMYEYNKLIDELFKDKDCIGVSLKKATSPSVKMEVMKHKDVKGIKDALNMKIDVTKVDYLESNQKCLVYFDMAGKKGHYLDIRGFESSRKIADVQVQLSKTGSSAAHGKITLPVISLITKRSQGGRAFMAMKSQRNKLFKKTFQKSGIHNFTDWKIFSAYTKKDMVKELQNDLQNWATYIEFLSSNKHKSNHITGKVMEMIGKNTSKSIFDAAKFLKHKVQSYEVGYLLDKEQKIIKEDVKNNIIKSMVAYAGSKGMIIFNDRNATAYMTSSTYMKVGG